MKKGRRKFFSRSIAAILGSGFPAMIVSAQSPDTKKVKMLTSKGEVVEVDADIVELAKGQNTSNKEIMEWSDQILNKTSS